MTSSAIEASGERLNGWKQIAAFLGRDESTVKRWEGTRGLPIRRLPGHSGGGVYAFRDELQGWLRGDARADPPPADRVRLRPPRPGRVAAAGGLALGVLTAFGALGTFRWVFSRPADLRPADPRHAEAAELYRRGEYLWSQRTPGALQAATDLFTQSVIKDPSYAEPYAGLASSYLMMREFSAMPAAQAYPRAEDAAQRALALDPNSVEAHTALGFVRFWWSWDRQGAWREFRRAIALDPSSSTPRHWYATALLATGDAAGALREIDAARQRHTGDAALLADRALVLAILGRRREAEDILLDVTGATPTLSSAWRYLYLVYRDEHRYSKALDALGQAGRLSGSAAIAAVVTAGRKGLAKGGASAMYTAMYAADLAQQHGEACSLRLAEESALAGQKGATVACIKAMIAHHDPDLACVASMAILRSACDDPSVHQLLEQAHLI